MSNPQELIDAAYDVIGEGNSETDWEIVPTEHAELFADQAGSLSRNLRGSRPKGLAQMYEELNEKAIKARDNFKRTVSRTDTAVFCTATLAALLLVAGGLQQPLGKAGPWVIGAIGILGVIAGGLATMWLNQIKGGDLAKKWSSARARAEAKRLAYFKSIMEGASDEPLEQLIVFEYTRRFLLDNQIDYFRDRGDRHLNAADIALKTSTQAVFVASIFTAVAGLLAILVPQLVVIAGLGVIASAYATLTMSRSTVNQDQKNADRYSVAEEQLKERKFDLDTYREMIASGDKGAVQEFFEPIFVALEADHKGFLNDAEQRELAIGAMEKRLDTAKAALNKKATGKSDSR
jgi:type II secretory pathway pseudopilin PulG